MTDRIIPSTCEECSVRCGSLIHLRDGKVVRITGNPDHPHSRGAFCVKGAHAPIVAQAHPDRPLEPRRRVGERGAGRWETVSWETALDAIADRLAAVKATHGPLAFAGAVSNHLVNRGVAMQLLLRSLGSPNVMINQDLCQGCRATASLASGITAQPGSELARARAILVVGKSPSDSNVVQWMQIKAAKRAGAKLIVIDPRRTQVARLADVWLAPRPGTDVVVALAMIDVLFGEQLIDVDFVERFCTGATELRERARGYPAATAAGIAGVPAKSIIEAARLFATVKPGCTILGHGIDAQANGVYTALAFDALLALTGNIDRPGANRSSKRLAGFRDYLGIPNDPRLQLPKERAAQVIGGTDYPLWSGPRSWSKTCHNPGVIRAIATGVPYPVRALYVSGVNIVCTYPDMRRTIEALHSLDLLVVATDHMTPTAELADFVLPKTTLLEEEGVFNDAGGPCLSVIRRALPPRGEARTDIEIAIALHERCRARGLVEFDTLPWESARAFIDYQLADTGLSFDAIVERGFHAYPFDYGAHESSGFATPSKRIELMPRLLADAGYDALPDYRPPAYSRHDDGFDLTLLTGLRSMAYHHSRFRNHPWARRAQDTPELRIHPQTAARLGIASDDWVVVETRGNADGIYLQAFLTEEMPLDVVGTGMGWWFPELAGFDRGALHFNVEAALPYGPPWDPITGSAEARNTACRIQRADPTTVAALRGRSVTKEST